MKQPEVSVDEAIEALSAEAMVCRDLSHSWQPHTAARIPGGYQRTLRCRSCLTERVEDLDSRGGMVSRYYVYPDNYLVKGVGRFNGEYKDAARLNHLLRSLPPEEKPKKAKKKAPAKKA